MSKENKYNQYVSQQPTDGDPNSRAYKKRKWKVAWKDYFLAQEGKMNYIRELRREAWLGSYKDFLLNLNNKINS